MTQTDLEARLAQIEAEYAEEIAKITAKIREQKADIEEAHAIHDMTVSERKRIIIALEADATQLKAVRARKKADAFEMFNQTQPEPL